MQVIRRAAFSVVKPIAFAILITILLATFFAHRQEGALLFRITTNSLLLTGRNHSRVRKAEQIVRQFLQTRMAVGLIGRTECIRLPAGVYSTWSLSIRHISPDGSARTAGRRACLWAGQSGPMTYVSPWTVRQYTVIDAGRARQNPRRGDCVVACALLRK